MAKMKLEFDLNEEREAAKQAMKAQDAYTVLWEFGLALRGVVKYSENKQAVKYAEAWRETFHDLCEEYNINPDGE